MTLLYVRHSLPGIWKKDLSGNRKKVCDDGSRTIGILNGEYVYVSAGGGFSEKIVKSDCKGKAELLFKGSSNESIEKVEAAFSGLVIDARLVDGRNKLFFVPQINHAH